MKWITIAIIVLLIILHQDWWWWESTSLVFGVVPVGLAYHACVSLVAGVLWALAVKYCWPEEASAELTEFPVSAKPGEGGA